MNHSTATSAFIAKLLAPLPEIERAAMESEDRAERAKDWHRHWLIARREMHKYEAAELDRLYNVFHGDKTQRDTSEAKSSAYEALERLVLTPVTNRDDMKTKRVLARKLGIRDDRWPQEWVAAFEDDERHIVARKRRA